MNERLNIRRMQLPEKGMEQNKYFDERRDITPELWKLIDAYVPLLEVRMTTEPDRFIDEYTKFLVNLSILGHSHTEVPDTYWKKLALHLLHLRTDKSQDDLFWFAARAHLLDPIHAHELTLLDAKEWKEIKILLDESRVGGEGFVIAKKAVDMTILGKPPELSEEDWKSMHESYETALARSKWDTSDLSALERLIAFAANMKLLDQEKAPVLSDEEWTIMKKELESASTVPETFVQLAASIKILAAGEAKITSRGIEITMKKRNDKEKTPTMPETPML